MSLAWFRPFASLLALCFAPALLHAHGPFDSSARLVADEDALRLEATLGLEAAAHFLGGRVLPQTAAIKLPLETAPRLFEVTDGERPLAATEVQAGSDGLEVSFTVTYPRPPAGVLLIRAKYFNDLEPMRGGAFVAMDGNGNQFASALLSRASASVRVRLPPLTSNTQSAALGAARSPEQQSQSTPPASVPAPPLRPSFGQFLRLGVLHILTGFDHLLFLCALLIGVRKLGAMLALITCFTLAHSLTLALAALEWVTLSSRIVEPLIAASIIAVGLENLFRQEAVRDRLWLAGAFGFVHGFGFAGALRETGLGHSGASLVAPLFSFNLGVEIGQLAVALVVVPLLLLLRRAPAFGRYGASAISVLVVMVSSYWLVERICLR